MMDVRILPASGTLKGGTHTLPLRVYCEDTDIGGIVYHANYLRFAERGRTEMLRAMGIELRRLQGDDGLIFVVRKGEMEYRNSAALDDFLIVETVVSGIRGASVYLKQHILRVSETEENEELFNLNVQVACTDQDGKAARIPDILRVELEQLL